MAYEKLLFRRQGVGVYRSRACRSVRAILRTREDENVQPESDREILKSTVVSPKRDISK